MKLINLFRKKQRIDKKIGVIHVIFIFFGLILIILLVQVYLPKPKNMTVSASISGHVPVKIEFMEQSSSEVKLERFEVYSGKATWYGNEFHGRLSANGEVFDEMGMTAASNDLPFGTRVLVTYEDKSVEVRITDRGGFTHDFDLSKGAFMKLAPLEKGILYINYSIL